VPFTPSSYLEIRLLDFKSISNVKPVLFMRGIRTISIGPYLVKQREYCTLVSFMYVWGAESFLFLCSHLPTFIPYFQSIPIKKIAILRLGISTIHIRSHLVEYYQYITRLTLSNIWRIVPLFWMFASDIVTYVIQIDFNWQKSYIPNGNKERINRNSIG
jgi:uncharacterized protein YcsI (UPF0317 family)